MGLSVTVGLLAQLKTFDEDGADYLRGTLAVLNRLLEDEKLALHTEPESFETPPRSRNRLVGNSYSWIHYLRRAFAYARQDPDAFAPLEPSDDYLDNPISNPLIDRELTMYMDSHLVCHSDSQGYYVPQDFTYPIYDSKDARVPGGIVGSSFMLQRELIRVAPLIGIPLTDDGELTDETAAVLNAEAIRAETRFYAERQSWFSLFEAARLSIRHASLIVFH